MQLDKCKHYRGPIVNQTCLADVNYLDLIGEKGFGWIRRLPCFKDHNAKVCCDKREFPTEEEVQEFDKWLKQRHTVMAEAHRRCLESAEAAGFIKDKRGASGTAICPVCDQQLKYSIATNGHVWAQCMTPGCISWIQ